MVKNEEISDYNSESAQKFGKILKWDTDAKNKVGFSILLRKEKHEMV